MTKPSTKVPATNLVSLDPIMSTHGILSEPASFEANSLSNVPAVGSVPTATTLSDLCQKLRALILQLSVRIASLSRRLHTVTIGSDLEQTLRKYKLIKNIFKCLKIPSMCFLHTMSTRPPLLCLQR